MPDESAIAETAVIPGELRSAAPHWLRLSLARHLLARCAAVVDEWRLLRATRGQAHGRRRRAWQQLARAAAGLALALGALAPSLVSLWRTGEGDARTRAAEWRLEGSSAGLWNGGALPVLKLDAALPGTIELSSLNGTNGFTANGISDLDSTGRAVSGADDVNGDGFADILIGAPQTTANGAGSGQSYVIYGGPGVPTPVQISALNGTNGFRVNGVSSSDNSGFAVSGAGDVNMDGFDDILIGAYGANPNGDDSGQSYVVYGGSALPATVELSALNGTNGFRLNGISSSDNSGFAVSGAGDVNMDGFDDILIGAYGANPNGDDSGQSYVVYGGSALPATVQLSALNGTNGFRLNGISSSDFSGVAVSGAGDVNMDGFDDILIGADGANPNENFAGQSYVVYGGSGLPATIQLSGLNGTNGFRVNGIAATDFSGRAVSGAGDVNMDGFDDILIGAPNADPNGFYSGQSYVVYGGSAVPSTVELSALNGANGFRVDGISTSNFAGFAVSGAGDVNMDGFDDILIGAFLADPNGSASGQSYVVYGGSGLPATIQLSALNGTNGFRANGEIGTAGSGSGFAVSGAGDVNMDGFDDILIGTYRARAYVVYGDGVLPPTPTPTPTPSAPQVSISDPFACTDNGDTLNVQVVLDNPGGALSGATVQATLPAGLSGLAGTCIFTSVPGTPTCVVTPGDMTWTGDIPAASTLTIDYQVRVAAGVPLGTQLCIDTVFDPGTGGGPSVRACTTLNCAPTAAELRSFTAAAPGDHVALAWETASEAEVLGFNLYRSEEESDRGVRVNRALIAATGGAAEGAGYRLRDLPPAAGTYFYRLEVVNRDGAPDVFGPVALRWDGVRLFLPVAAP